MDYNGLVSRISSLVVGSMELLQRQIKYTDNMHSLQERESLGPRLQRHLFIHHHALRPGQQPDPE